MQSQMFYKASAILSLFIFATACGSRKSAPVVDDGDTATDSATIAIEEPRALPDTALASAGIVSYTVEIADSAVSGSFPADADFYAAAPGVFTFRKGMQRDARFGGRVKGTPADIVVDWTFRTDVDDRETRYGRWGGGTGWTGQPLYVEWPDSCMARFRSAGMLGADASRQEIIVGSLASRVYFIDYATGKPSRRPVDVVNPVKGTMSLDPTLNGNLYVGLGVPAERPFGARVIDLYKGAVTCLWPEDPRAGRRWDAYDSSPLRIGRFLFWPGENGTLYKFTVSPGAIALHSVLRYTIDGAAPGIENSLAVYRNYGYFGDNHGNLLCVNLETLKPVWRYFVGDDIDATPVVTTEDDRPYVYACCEVDRRGEGTANLVKVDALTGAEVWRNEIPARRVDVDGKHFDGGYYATPLPGTGDCAGMLFANCVLNESDERRNGIFVAIDRKSGREFYRTPLRYYSWSSPVGFVNETGEQFVVTGDAAGNIYVIRGRTGEILVRRPTGHNFESSPVVVGNSLVVGSRGDTVYRLSII